MTTSLDPVDRELTQWNQEIVLAEMQSRVKDVHKPEAGEVFWPL
jgi:hypothetical protein